MLQIPRLVEVRSSGDLARLRGEMHDFVSPVLDGCRRGRDGRRTTQPAFDADRQLPDVGIREPNLELPSPARKGGPCRKRDVARKGDPARRSADERCEVRSLLLGPDEVEMIVAVERAKRSSEPLDVLLDPSRYTGKEARPDRNADRISLAFW